MVLARGVAAAHREAGDGRAVDAGGREGEHPGRPVRCIEPRHTPAKAHEVRVRGRVVAQQLKARLRERRAQVGEVAEQEGEQPHRSRPSTRVDLVLQPCEHAPCVHRLNGIRARRCIAANDRHHPLPNAGFLNAPTLLRASWRGRSGGVTCVKHGACRHADHRRCARRLRRCEWLHAACAGQSGGGCRCVRLCAGLARTSRVPLRQYFPLHRSPLFVAAVWQRCSGLPALQPLILRALP